MKLLASVGETRLLRMFSWVLFRRSLRGGAQFSTLFRLKSNDSAGIFHFTLEPRWSLITGFNLEGAFPLLGRLGKLRRMSGKLTASLSDLIGFLPCGRPRLFGNAIHRREFWHFGRKRVPIPKKGSDARLTFRSRPNLVVRRRRPGPRILPILSSRWNTGAPKQPSI